MSIGKSSIVRAADSAATAQNTKKTPKTQKAPIPEQAPIYLEPALEALIPLAAVPAAEAPAELVRSIRKYGILEPVILCRTPDEKLWLANGVCRLLAARKLGLSTIPARVFPVADHKEALRIYRTLAAFSHREERLHDAKFAAIVSVTEDLPDYLL